MLCAKLPPGRCRFTGVVRERLKTTYSDVPIKLRSTLEKSGCEVTMEQIVRICGESAVVEHLRRECRRHRRPDIGRTRPAFTRALITVYTMKEAQP